MSIAGFMVVSFGLVVITLTGVAIWGAAYRLVRQVNDLREQAGELNRRDQDRARELEALSARVDELRSHRRLPNTVSTAFDDALAVALDTIQEYEASRLYTEGRIRQLADLMRRVRADPYRYDEDRPNQKIPFNKRAH